MSSIKLNAEIVNSATSGNEKTPSRTKIAKDKVNSATVKVITQSRTKNSTEFPEAWYFSERPMKRHIDLDHIYLPMRSKGLHMEI